MSSPRQVWTDLALLLGISVFVCVIGLCASCDSRPAIASTTPPSELPAFTSPDPTKGLATVGTDAKAAGTTILTETAKQRVAVADAKTKSPPAAWPTLEQILTSCGVIEPAAKKVVELQVRVDELNAQQGLSRKECSELRAVAEHNADLLTKANDTITKQGETIQKMADEEAKSFKLMLNKLAIGLIVLGLIAFCVMGWEIYLAVTSAGQTGGTGATIAGICGVTAFGGAALVNWYADHLTLILCVSGSVLAIAMAYVGYMIWTKRSLTAGLVAAKTTLKAVVTAGEALAEEMPSAGEKFKAGVQAAAGNAATMVKEMVTTTKHDAGLGAAADASIPTPLAAAQQAVADVGASQQASAEANAAGGQQTIIAGIVPQSPIIVNP